MLIFRLFVLLLTCVLPFQVQAAAVGNENHAFGSACSPDKANGADWDTLFQCKNGTWQRAPYYFGASADTCDASHAGVVQWTGAALQFCNGTSWGVISAAAGSSGQVQYNNGGVFAGASSLIYTATGSVGIGTASPVNQLDINGSQGILSLGANGWVNPGVTGSGILTDNNSYKALMIIGNNVSGNSGKGREVKVWDYLNVQGALNTTGGATFNGSVGIGVAPAYTLDVNGTTHLTGALTLGSSITCLQGLCPTNGVARLTPNLHLNSGAGNAVILNWDNGTTGATNTLRIGNGAGADVFDVQANGDTYISGKVQTTGSVGVGVAPSQALTVSGNVLATGVFYPSNQTSYYLYGETGNSGLRTNGNFLASGNIYWGTGGNWLNAYLNQAVLTTSAPTFANLYLSSNLYLGYLGDWISNRLNQSVATSSQPNFWNVYLGYLGWISDFINQDVRNGSAPTFADVYASNWYRVNGSGGIYWQAYGGGWNMSDSTWIRSYNGKPVYMAGGFDTASASGVGCGGGLGGGYTFRVCGNQYVSSTFSAGSDIYAAGNLHMGSVLYGGQRPDFFLSLQGDRNMCLYDYGGTVWCSGSSVSDRRLKKEIKPLDLGLKDIMRLRSVWFHWKETEFSKTRQIGFIAQEVRKILPEIVYEQKGRLGIYYDKIVPLLVNGIQELKTLFDQDHAEIIRLRAENELLKARMNTLEQAVEDLRAARVQTPTNIPDPDHRSGP